MQLKPIMMQSISDMKDNRRRKQAKRRRRPLRNLSSSTLAQSRVSSNYCASRCVSLTRIMISSRTSWLVARPNTMEILALKNFITFQSM